MGNSNPIVERVLREGLAVPPPFSIDDLAALAEALKAQSYGLPELVVAITEYGKTIGHLAFTAIARRDKAIAR